MKIYRFKFVLLSAIMGLLLLSCGEGDKFDYNKNVLFISGTEVSPVVKFVIDDTPSTYPVTVSSTAKVKDDIKVKFVVDNAALEAYNANNKTNYFPIPESSIQIEDDEVIIPAGKTFSSTTNVKIISTEDWVDGRVYVIPLTMKRIEGENLEVLKPSETIFLRTARTFSFNSLSVSSSELYSNYHFDKSKPGFTPIDLPSYTCEIKLFLMEDKPNRIRRLCNWGGTGGQNMLRFGEEGMDRNMLQWVSPSGSVSSKTLFSPHRWYTVSLTFNGSKYIMYVDGVKESELAGTSQFAFSTFEIGMSWASYNYSQRVDGRIAEVRLWNKALLSSEIQMGICGVDPKSDGLVAYWKMNEGSGHIFHDVTGNGYDLDWSDTWRVPYEGGGSFQYDKSRAVTWVIDDNNKCSQ